MSADLTLCHIDFIVSVLSKNQKTICNKIHTFVLCGKGSYLHPIYLNLEDPLLKAIF